MRTFLTRRTVLRLGLAAAAAPLVAPGASRAAEEKRFVFTASPVNSVAQGKKLQAVLEELPEVHQFSLASGKRKGTATVTVTAELDGPQPLIDAAKKAGFTLKPAAGGGGQPPKPGGKSVTTRYTASGVSSKADGARLKDALLEVEGVRQVSLKATRQKGVVQVTVISSDPAPAEGLASAAREAGFTLKPAAK